MSSTTTVGRRLMTLSSSMSSLVSTRRGGVSKRGFAASASADFANENREFVIVGGGNAAGYAAREFVEHGMAHGRLCIVSKEAYAPYERPALTKGYLFPHDKKPSRLPGFHTCVGAGGERQTPEWYTDKGIEMIYEDPVAETNFLKQTLTTESGKVLKYGSLIIATGCTASRFPEGIGGNLIGVHYIREVVDADSLLSSLENAHKVVVVGGGYIGMEVAAAAASWKLDTTIVFPGEHLLPRLFTSSLTQKYEALYRENGVKFFKGVSIRSFEAGSSGRVNAVKLENGSTIDADTVIVGIGARPNVGPFKGIALNKNLGGIQVDGQFRTNAAGVVAIGDVAAFPLKFFGDNVGEPIEIGKFDPKIATFWIESGKLKGVLVESGSIEELELLPKLARSQPFIDITQLQSTSSVEEALEVARASLLV